jgi:hypothetical protein
VFAEGCYRLWYEGQIALAAVANPEPQLELNALLQEQLRRGRRLRATARVSSDGTAGSLDTWETDVALLLEDYGRHDLIESFDVSEFADKARAAVSGPWSTKTRIDRKLKLLSTILEEEAS